MSLSYREKDRNIFKPYYSGETSLHSETYPTDIEMAFDSVLQAASRADYGFQNIPVM